MLPKICFKEIGRYSVAGISSTILDWGLFYLMINFWHMHYQIALFLALSLSSILNYKVNKHYTFKSQCSQGMLQFTSYFILVISTLLLSSVCMHTLISRFQLNEMYARVFTTLLLAVLNYFLTKYITFNRFLFKDRI